MYLFYFEEDYLWVREYFLFFIDEWEIEENNVIVFGIYKIYCSD